MELVSNLICAKIFQHRIRLPRFKDWTPDVFHVSMLLLNARAIYKVLPEPPGGFTVVPIITGFEVVAWPDIVGRGTWLEYTQQQNFRCQMQIKGYRSYICHHYHYHHHHLFWKYQFFPRYRLGDTSHELTRLIVGQSPLCRHVSTHKHWSGFWQCSICRGEDVSPLLSGAYQPPSQVCITPPPRKNSQNKSKIHCWPPSGFPTNRVLVFVNWMSFLASNSCGLMKEQTLGSGKNFIGSWNSNFVTSVHDGNWSRSGGIAFPVLCEKGLTGILDSDSISETIGSRELLGIELIINHQAWDIQTAQRTVVWGAWIQIKTGLVGLFEGEP